MRMGEKCVMYPAQDIISLYVAYKSFVTQQTTYCNFPRVWLNSKCHQQVLGDTVSMAVSYGRFGR